MTKKILIVEDHPLFAEAMELVISHALPDVVITSASSLADAKQALDSASEFALILLDLWLPDTHGFDGLIELRRWCPKVPIVIVSAFADAKVVEKAFVCGAAGFIPKASAKKELVGAVRQLLAGNAAGPPHAMCSKDSDGDGLRVLSRRLRSLTRQQLRVLQMLCQGLLNKQIAFELEVGETTVKAHVSEILRKLSVTSRTQAVLEVSRLNFSSVLALYEGEEAQENLTA